ncbi:5686_t:CDS:2, partial [Funneliformis mosseae]
MQSSISKDPIDENTKSEYIRLIKTIIEKAVSKYDNKNELD